MGLSPHSTKLVCRAHNAAAVNAARETGENFIEKFAKQQYLDPEEVIAGVYPKADTNTKVASVYLNLNLSSASVERSKKRMQKLGSIEGMKTRLAARPPKKKPEVVAGPVPTSPKTAALRDRLRLQRMAAEVRSANLNARKKFAAAIDCLTVATDPQRVQLLREANRYVQDDFGKIAIDHLASMCLSEHQLKKFAADTPVIYNTPPDQNPILRQLPEIREAVSRWKKMAADYFVDKMVTIARHSPGSSLQKAADTNWPMPGKTIEETREILVRQAEETLRKSAIAPSSFAGGMIGSMFGGKSHSEGPGGIDTGLDEARLRLNSPRHDDKIRLIRAQTALHQLMNTDEVVSKHDPQEVLNAFNAVSQTSPHAVANDVSLQAYLRRYLQGHTEPFEVAQLVDLENKLRPGTQNNAHSR